MLEEDAGRGGCATDGGRAASERGRLGRKVGTEDGPRTERGQRGDESGRCVRERRGILALIISDCCGVVAAASRLPSDDLPVWHGAFC